MVSVTVAIDAARRDDLMPNSSGDAEAHVPRFAGQLIQWNP
jgi:hypothetical protein